MGNQGYQDVLNICKKNAEYLNFFSTIRKWQAQGIQIVIIHGGGHYITELMEQFQVKRQIKNGLRVTDETTLELTKMALLGQV